MCGRYYVDEWTKRMVEELPGGREAAASMKNGDVHPAEMGIVLTGKQWKMRAVQMKWGFPWPEKKRLLINARAETVFSRQAFRESAVSRRCVVPANESVALVHQRMPVLLEREELEEWLWEEKAARRIMERKPPCLERNQEYEQQRLPFLE